MISTRCSTLSLGALALLSACGSAPRTYPAIYTAEQLNSFATQPPPEEVAGATNSMGMTANAGGMDPTPPTPPARVRVIHASPDAAAASVAVYLDDATTPAIASLAYRAAAGYADVPSGAHTLQIRPAAAAATTAPVLAGASPALASGDAYTVIAYGVVGAPQLAFASTDDGSPEPEAGHAHVRFFHGLVGLGAVDVCVPGATAVAPATAVFSNVAFGAFGRSDGPGQKYVSITAASAVTLQVRAHAPVACRGRVIGHVVVTPPDRAVVTAVAAGRLASVGHPAVASQVLVCTDAPTATSSECAALPVRPGPMPPAARPAAPAAHAARPAAPAARPAAPAAH